MSATPRLRLPSGTTETFVENWREGTFTDFSTDLLGFAQSQHGDHGALGPIIIAVNGRSGSGKTTLARALAMEWGSHEPGLQVASLAADDLMWWEPMWQWHPLAIDGVFEALRRGQDATLVPPMWKERGRAGSLHVPQGADVLLFEGVGSSQIAFTEYLDASVWVQSDYVLAKQGGLARDVESGVNGGVEEAERFWDEWAESENKFLEDDMPWVRADFFVEGVSNEMPQDRVLRFNQRHLFRTCAGLGRPKKDW